MKLRWYPDSLFGRLITALLAVVVTTGIIIAVLLMRERRDIAFRGSDAAGVVELITQTSTELNALAPADRAERLAELGAEGLVIDVPRSAGPPRADRDPVAQARAFRSRLARALGSDYTVAIRPARGDDAQVIRIDRARRERPDSRDDRQPPVPDFDSPPEDLRRSPGGGGARRGPGGGPQLDVVVALRDAGTVIFRTGLPLSEPRLPQRIFVELGLLTLVLGVVLFVMTRTITRPLSELASAAESVGRGARRQPLRETGARELREATRAFNAMQERLNRYLDSRTRVLGAMSHDLRTPLTRLKLRVESLDEGLRERFTADLDQMSEMIEGALDVFRGLNHEEPEVPVDIAELLEELRAEFADMSAEVTLEADVDRPIVAKPKALKRCLTNLISNAVNYGTRATVVAEIEGPDLVLRVLDEGPGIPPGALERVFEPFFRLEGSRNTSTGGTGLGLGIARDIAQAHGGTLTLKNRSPRGLEAVLRLPIAGTSQSS